MGNDPGGSLAVDCYFEINDQLRLGKFDGCTIHFTKLLCAIAAPFNRRRFSNIF